MNHSQLRTELREAALRFAEAIADAFENASSLPEWVSQNESPLGNRRHRELVRAGVFPRAKRDGKRVLIHRADIAKYLDEHPALTREQETGEGSADKRAAERLGLVPVRGRR